MTNSRIDDIFSKYAKFNWKRRTKFFVDFVPFFNCYSFNFLIRKSFPYCGRTFCELYA